MTDGLLPALENIEPSRDVHVRLISTLEKLTELENDIVGKHTPLNGSNPTHSDYDIIHWNTLKRIEGIDFDSDDIAQFIFSVSYKDDDVFSSQLLGMFTGALVHILTERNQRHGKRTKLYFNGNGITFNYLFFHAEVIDELVVENFNGDYICANVAYASKLPSYPTQDNTRNTSTIIDDNYLEGKISIQDNTRNTRVCCININGYGTLTMAGRNSDVNQIIGIDINGNLSFWGCGSNGYVGQLIVVNMVGDNNLNDVGEKGIINDAILVDIKDKNALNREYKKRNFSKFNRLIYDNVECISGNVRDENVRDGELIHRETPTPEQKRMIELTKSMQGKPYHEVLAIADELYALRPEVPKEFFK